MARGGAVTTNTTRPEARRADAVQPWPLAAASFLGMWLVMMIAMMLPSLLPMLSRYRRAVGGAGESYLGGLTALVALGYFFVWSALRLGVFALGLALKFIVKRANV